MGLSIARALVTDYELLVIHRPTSNLSSNAMLPVMELLWEYVQNRGVCMPEEWWLRRPRTCIFSSHIHGNLAQCCDVCFTVSASGIQKLPRDFTYEHFRHDQSLLDLNKAKSDPMRPVATEYSCVTVRLFLASLLR